ncbi:Protein RCC2-like protein [Frankliniella fusca]|uniref:Protein RCC2-like protein n=1 Tax=Frankliniella fusca TaxID=407009 RepID=A0AAE1H103_9NEOP|nr:Protein RCC2-like protein [Frankliniella fusca]
MSSKREIDEVEEAEESGSAPKQIKVDSNGGKAKAKKVKDSDDENENGVGSEAEEDEDKSDTEKEDDIPSVPVEIPEKEKGKVLGPEGTGIVLICGGTNWDAAGRKTAPKGCKNSGPNLWSPHLFGPLSKIRVRLVASGPNAAHSIVISEDGKAYSFGRNEKGQLGHGDEVRRDTPLIIDAVKDEVLVGAACGRNHTLLLSVNGEVFAMGDNKNGQCGVKNSSQATIPTAKSIFYKGAPIVKVGCGGEFSIILDCKGAMHSFGLPEYGQLGHNTDGKYFVTSTKMGFHCELAPKRIVCFIERTKDGKIKPVEVDEIRDFSCGTNHTCAIDSRKRLFSWGFGGIGRLGHAEQRDEFVPRLIKFFDSQNRGVRNVWCGSSYSLAINDFGVMYMFGQNKRTGEANMYPKPIQDLTGWNVRSVGVSNSSIVVAADDSVIAWGPSPTSGELGLGEIRKSSTTPLEVKSLDGMYIEQVTCGISHTLFIARDKSDEEKKRIEAFEVYTPA